MDPVLGGVAVALMVLAAGGCLAATMRGDPRERLVALQGLGVVITVVLVLLTVAQHRPAYLDIPLVLALVSFAGSLVFARFFGRPL